MRRLKCSDAAEKYGDPLRLTRRMFFLTELLVLITIAGMRRQFVKYRSYIMKWSEDSPAHIGAEDDTENLSISIFKYVEEPSINDSRLGIRMTRYRMQGY